MNVLLIGGTGSLSGPILSMLLKSSCSVECITRGNNIPYERQAEMLGARFIHIACISSLDEQSLQSLSDEYDFVVDFVTYSSADVKSKINLLASRISKAYFYISTTAFYKRPSPSLLPWQEQNVHVFHDWKYAVNKYEAELMLSLMSEPLPFKAISIRLGHTIGSAIPVFLGNPGQAFIDHVSSGLPIPILGSIDHIWSVGTASGLCSVLLNLFARSASLPNYLAFHFSETHTSWLELCSVLCDQLNVPLRLRRLDLQKTIQVAAHWTPSVVFHKMHEDYYDLSVLQSFIPLPPSQSVADIVEFSLSATLSNSREISYERDRNLLHTLSTSPDLSP